MVELQKVQGSLDAHLSQPGTALQPGLAVPGYDPSPPPGPPPGYDPEEDHHRVSPEDAATEESPPDRPSEFSNNRPRPDEEPASAAVDQPVDVDEWHESDQRDLAPFCT